MRNYLVITLTVVLTACLIKLAYIERGYWAVGLEWVLWIVPLVWAAGNKKAPTSEGGAS